MDFVEKITQNYDYFLQLFQLNDRKDRKLVRLSKFLQILESQNVDTQDEILHSILNLSQINVEKKYRKYINYIMFLQFLKKNYCLLISGDSIEDKSYNSTTPNELISENSFEKHTIEFAETKKTQFRPSLKEKAKYIFYVLEKIIKSYYWKLFKQSYDQMIDSYSSNTSINISGKNLFIKPFCLNERMLNNQSQELNHKTMNKNDNHLSISNSNNMPQININNRIDHEADIQLYKSTRRMSSNHNNLKEKVIEDQRQDIFHTVKKNLSPSSCMPHGHGWNYTEHFQTVNHSQEQSERKHEYDSSQFTHQDNAALKSAHSHKHYHPKNSICNQAIVAKQNIHPECNIESEAYVLEPNQSKNNTKVPLPKVGYQSKNNISEKCYNSYKEEHPTQMLNFVESKQNRRTKHHEDINTKEKDISLTTLNDTNGSEINSIISDIALESQIAKTQRDDNILIKLYAEKLLRKNLEKKMEKIQKQNIDLIIEKNANMQTINLAQHKSNRIRYQSFVWILKVILKCISNKLFKEGFDHIKNHHIIVHFKKIARNFIFDKLKKNIQQNLQIGFEQWKIHTFGISNSIVRSQHLETNYDISNLFELSTKSLLSPAGNYNVLSRRQVSNKKAVYSGLTIKDLHSQNRMMIHGFEKLQNLLIRSVFKTLKQLAANRKKKEQEKLKKLEELENLINKKNLIYICNGFYNIYHYIRDQKYLRILDMLNESRKLHLLKMLSIMKHNKLLQKSFNKWKECFYKIREQLYAKNVKKVSDNFNKLTQKYQNIAKYYDYLNKKYDQYMIKNSSADKENSANYSNTVDSIVKSKKTNQSLISYIGGCTPDDTRFQNYDNGNEIISPISSNEISNHNNVISRIWNLEKSIKMIIARQLEYGFKRIHEYSINNINNNNRISIQLNKTHNQKVNLRKSASTYTTIQTTFNPQIKSYSLTNLYLNNESLGNIIPVKTIELEAKSIPTENNINVDRKSLMNAIEFLKGI